MSHHVPLMLRMSALCVVHHGVMVKNAEAWRRLSIWPAAAGLIGVVLLNLLGFLIDQSSLDQGVDSWGYLFGTVAVSLFYGVPALLIVLVLVVIARVVEQPTPFVWAAAILTALSGAGLIVVGWLQLGGPTAGLVFAAGASVIGLGLMVPLWWCWRQRRLESTSA